MIKFTKRYEFTVVGVCEFPLDMLRYDSAVPATSEDVNNMNYSFDLVLRKEYRHRNQRFTVKLISFHHAPTSERWASFGWKVTEMREVKL